MGSDSTVTDLTRGIYRRLYAGFIKGRRINQVSLQAEAWFWRILASADDFGNADADLNLLFAATVGNRKGISIKDVNKWVGELRESGLIQMYASESGDKYLHIQGFEDMQPAGKNGRRVKRFPAFCESGGIRGNPVPSGIPHSHSDNHTHTEGAGSKAALVRSVFEFWQEHLNHPNAKLDSKREGAIMARLKAGYSVDDLKAAIRGCKNTPHNMGDNDRHEVYDDIELICRDSGHVESFMPRANENGTSQRVPTIAERIGVV